MTSTAMPYTRGDIKKSGELGKLFDISVETPKTKRSGPISSASTASSTTTSTRTGSFRANPSSNLGPFSNPPPPQITHMGSLGVAFATISSKDWFTCGVREDYQKMVANFWGMQGNAANKYMPMSLRAGMGLCVKHCNEGEYELRDFELWISNQCLENRDMKVCLECIAGQQCPPPNSTSLSTPFTPPPNSSSHSITGIHAACTRCSRKLTLSTLKVHSTTSLLAPKPRAHT